jgi:protease PrsW
MIFGDLYSRILVISAVLPAIALLIYVYKKDRREKEPAGLILSLVFLGIISTMLALVAESIGDGILEVFCTDYDLTYLVLENFIVVGLSEEYCKYIVMKKRTWKNDNFNCTFDGVVYAVAVAMGFALWENIAYVFEYGFGTALLRAVTAVPGHASFGVFMGIWYGMARKESLLGNARRSKSLRRTAVLLPAFIHGMYDFLASIEDEDFSLLFFPFVIILFIITFRMVKKASANDEYML